MYNASDIKTGSEIQILPNIKICFDKTTTTKNLVSYLYFENGTKLEIIQETDEFSNKKTYFSISLIMLNKHMDDIATKLGIEDIKIAENVSELKNIIIPIIIAQRENNNPVVLK